MTPPTARLKSLLDEAWMLHDRGALDEAKASGERALALAPNNSDVLHFLAVVEFLRGRSTEALAHVDQAILETPGHVRALALKGTMLLAAGRAADAVRPLKRAVQFAPNFVDALMHLGLAIDRSGGKAETAIDALERAVQAAPKDATVHFNLANVLSKHGHPRRAIDHYYSATASDPMLLPSWNNLGLGLRDLGDRHAAIAAWREGLRYALPGDPAAASLWSNLGNLLTEPAERSARLNAHRMAVALVPDNATYQLNYGVALKESGHERTAWIHYGRAYDVNPELIANHQPEIGFYRQIDETKVLALRRAEGDKLLASVGSERHPYANNRDPNRRLKVGYVSPDFCASSIAYFFEPVLASHNTEVIEVFCYSNVPAPDLVTERLKGLARNWRDITACGDIQAAKMIRSDGIDILVDLAGQTKGNRLPVLALKPAPVQVTWMGSPASTGLATVDWRIVDAMTDPVGITERHNVERLIRLPSGFLCYGPPQDAPLVAPPPALTRAQVTFGSFNDLAKVGATVIQLWADVLKKVPGSRLLLKHRAFADELVRRDFQRQFAVCGIAGDRLDLRLWSPTFLDHLKDYGEIDVALDPFPYNGTTTTCEALWMGVPVVTLSGERHVGRVGVSLLSRAGFGGWIAESPEHYVQIAARLAGDPHRLAEQRAAQRSIVARSPLTQAPRLTGELELAYREMWRTWCNGNI